MIDKIKTILKHPYVSQLKDIRVIELIIFCFIALLVTWSSISVIQQNYDLQKQIAQLEEKNQIQELENNNQSLKNEYYKSDQYLELQARSVFGKAAPGERLILVPKAVALAKTVDLKTPTDSQQASIKVPIPAYKPKFPKPGWTSSRAVPSLISPLEVRVKGPERTANLNCAVSYNNVVYLWINLKDTFYAVFQGLPVALITPWGCIIWKERYRPATADE